MSTFSDKSYDAKNYSQQRPKYPQSFYDKLNGYIGLKEGEKVPVAVDLACGPGEATLVIADRLGAKVFGVDPSDGMLSQARENAKQHGANIDFITGNDESITTQFAKHSVDLLCVAEAAHWFAYPDFWHTAHYLLKPGGTLAIWSYYIFWFEGYPESYDIIRNFSFSEDKCGTYWGAGQHHLYNLYDDLIIPTTLFENEERVKYTVNDTPGRTALELSRNNITVADILRLLNTYSAYHTWKQQNPEKKDILEATTEELLSKCNLTLETKVNVRWESVYMLAQAKQEQIL